MNRFATALYGGLIVELVAGCAGSHDAPRELTSSLSQAYGAPNDANPENADELAEARDSARATVTDLLADAERLRVLARLVRDWRYNAANLQLLGGRELADLLPGYAAEMNVQHQRLLHAANDLDALVAANNVNASEIYVAQHEASNIAKGVNHECYDYQQEFRIHDAVLGEEFKVDHWAVDHRNADIDAASLVSHFSAEYIASIAAW